MAAWTQSLGSGKGYDNSPQLLGHSRAATSSSRSWCLRLPTTDLRCSGTCGLRDTWPASLTTRILCCCHFKVSPATCPALTLLHLALTQTRGQGSLFPFTGEATGGKVTCPDHQTNLSLQQRSSSVSWTASWCGAGTRGLSRDQRLRRLTISRQELGDSMGGDAPAR